VNVSPESKHALAEEISSRKRPPPASRAEPEPKKHVASKPPAPKFKPKPAPTLPTQEPESDDDDAVVINMPADLPRGITQRPSGKWVSRLFLTPQFLICSKSSVNFLFAHPQQAQMYYAGKSRYLGVFKNKKNAFKAYEVARGILMGDEATRNASSSSDVNFYIAKARQAAKEALKK
jgi:hypothetical protein